MTNAGRMMRGRMSDLWYCRFVEPGYDKTLMAQVCTVCRPEKRNEIDHALLNGVPLRNVAKQSGTSSTALFRHKKEHIATTLASAKNASDEVKAETLFERLWAVVH